MTTSRWHAALGVLLLAAPLWAQDNGGAVLVSPPIRDLFNRAREGTERGDWKFVVDSLQRIIADPQGSLITADQELYESARMQAYRQLAALPADGRRTYQLLYGSEAAQGYRRALAEHDAAALEFLVGHYLLTEAGIEASLTLAGWSVDLGKPGLAIALLTDLRRLLPDHPANRGRIPLMLSLAYAQMQRLEDARRELEQLGGGAAADSIAEYLSAARGPGASPQTWPTVQGPATRTAITPATMPVLLDGMRWRYELPIRSPAPWSEVFAGQIRSGRLLNSQMVCDGTHLYLKADSQIIAIDLLSFEPEWVSPPPASAERSTEPVAGRFDAWQRQSDEPREDQPLVDALLSDSILAQLSLARGLLFDVVRPAGGPRVASVGGVFIVGGQGQWRVQVGNQTDSLRVPNQLVARAAAAGGDIRWRIGAGERPGHPLDAATFACTPLAAGDGLLVTYLDGNDLYVAILDPHDGRMQHSIYLCTTAASAESPVLLPAVADQFAYVPTASGLLLAVNLGDQSLRWASRYPRRSPLPPPPPALRGVPGLQPAPDTRVGWQAGPPVVAGATVLLAPADSDQLHAFDQATGRRLWHHDRGTHSYILGADPTHVWLGGRSIAQLDLATGTLQWRTQDLASGRAVMSGARIFVPTRTGLTALAAATGSPVDEQALPADHEPLGNLLCWSGALYSLDSQYLRKFPDLEQSYEPALALHRKRPADVAAGVRLAWMELLRKQPERVLATLENLRPADDPAGRRYLRHITHLRVKALIESARQASLPPAEAENRLRQALELASKPDDRFEATVALCDQLIRNQHRKEAYQRMWSMAHSTEMHTLIAHTPTWKQSAHAILLERLARLRAELTSAELEELTATLKPSATFEAEPTRRTRDELTEQLDLLAQGDDLAHWNQIAALRGGRLALQHQDYERADDYFRQAGDPRGDPAVAAEALRARIQLNLALNPGEVAPVDADLERLAALTEDAAGADPSPETALATLRQRAAEHRRAWLSRFAAAEPPTDDHATLIDAGEILTFQLDPRPNQRDLLLTFSEANMITARRVSDGGFLWDTQLRLPSESSHDAIREVSRRSTPPDRVLRGRCDGQTLIVNTASGLHAVGLLTGRRLWGLPIDPPSPVDEHVGDTRLFDVRDGRVAVRTSAHQVALHRTVADHPLLWRVQIPEAAIGGVQLARDRVLVLDDSGLRAVILDARSGARLFDVSFLPGDAEPPVKALVFDTVVCGLTRGHRLTAYSLADGAVAWERPAPESMVALFAASPDCVVVGGSNGRVLAVDPARGTVLIDGTLPIGSGGIVDGHHEGRALYLIGLAEESDGVATQLAAIDLDTQQATWANGAAGTAICNRSLLGALDDRIPLIYVIPGTRPTTDEDVAVGFLDKATGQPIGRMRLLGLDDAQRARATGQFAFWPGRLVLSTNRGTMEVRLHDPAATPDGG